MLSCTITKVFLGYIIIHYSFNQSQLFHTRLPIFLFVLILYLYLYL